MQAQHYICRSMRNKRKSRLLKNTFIWKMQHCTFSNIPPPPHPNKVASQALNSVSRIPEMKNRKFEIMFKINHSLAEIINSRNFPNSRTGIRTSFHPSPSKIRPHVENMLGPLSVLSMANFINCRMDIL